MGIQGFEPLWLVFTSNEASGTPSQKKKKKKLHCRPYDTYALTCHAGVCVWVGGCNCNFIAVVVVIIIIIVVIIIIMVGHYSIQVQYVIGSRLDPAHQICSGPNRVFLGLDPAGSQGLTRPTDSNWFSDQPWCHVPTIYEYLNWELCRIESSWTLFSFGRWKIMDLFCIINYVSVGHVL